MPRKLLKIFQTIACTLLIIITYFFVALIGRSGKPYFSIFGLPIISTSLQGVISSLGLVWCILLVFVDYKKGALLGSFLVVFFQFTNAMQMIRTHSINSLPGILTSAITLLSIVLISRFLHQATKKSITDFTTGLFNQRKLFADLKEKIFSKKEFYIAVLEIKDFKNINTSYGFEAGDIILKEISKLLLEFTNKKDMIYRVNGANFSIIFDKNTDVTKTIATILKVTHNRINVSKENDNTSVMVNMIAGIAKYPDNAIDATILYRKATIALGYALEEDAKNFYFYNENMEEAENNREEVEKFITDSLKNNSFYMEYQPQYDINDKQLRGFEALIRAVDKNGNVISPNEFIPIAEKSDLIMKIDDYVLNKVIHELVSVLNESSKRLTISINVSAKSISSEDFADKVISLIKNTDFPPAALEIEITEYSLDNSMENTIRNILELRKMGIMFALDDFGIGYTSIAKLMELPINMLKIDKSLVDKITDSKKNLDLIDSVIYMGHIMGCTVISEGVENPDQLELLKEHNCDFVQGFVWGKPTSFAETKMLCTK